MILFHPVKLVFFVGDDGDGDFLPVVLCWKFIEKAAPVHPLDAVHLRDLPGEGWIDGAALIAGSDGNVWGVRLQGF